MNLIATVLCGPDLSNLARAVASVVDHVDQILLINTVCDRDLEEACPILPRGYSPSSRKITIHAWPWQNRFDAARNEALALATEAGSDWAITLDADEWWTGAEQLRELCESAAPDVEAVHLRCGEASRYYQPRAIRLPCSRRWIGRTHEAIDFDGVRFKDDGPRFHSEPKTPEQIRAKFDRDLPLLLAEIAERPDEARWYYYLGNTYSGLGDGLDGSDPIWTQAIDAYLKSAQIGHDREHNALSYYRAADIMVRKRLEYKTAIEFCVIAMSEHAGMPEFPLLAGWASFRLAPLQPAEAARIACYEQALYFAALADVHGAGSPFGAIDTRIHHFDPEAVGLGPLRLMLEVYKTAGATEREQECRNEIERRGIRRSS